MVRPDRLGVVSIAQREIVLVLPPAFSAGAATAQVIATYDGKAIASNQLGHDAVTFDRERAGGTSKGGAPRSSASW